MASAFEFFLRTGAKPCLIETKFNAWHDPEDGRFTFAGQGRYYAGGQSESRAGADRYSRARTTGSDAHQSSRAGSRVEHTGPNDPKNPRNHSIHVVRRGDTLTKIAGLRRGLTVADLEWLNELSADRPLQIGQRIKLPHQHFLDAGRRARDGFLALAHYMEITGGKLPPDVAHPPSIAMQVEVSGRREFSSNGYRYEVDSLLRTRYVSGELQAKTERRSRRAQASAGRPDRHPTDDGGHFIAARFNGPRQWFNHFAQDANFNRGEYRALEDRWATEIQSGKRVFVDIVPQYRGTSVRPYKLDIIWIIDGQEQFKTFPNQRAASGHGN